MSSSVLKLCVVLGVETDDCCFEVVGSFSFILEEVVAVVFGSYVVVLVVVNCSEKFIDNESFLGTVLMFVIFAAIFSVCDEEVKKFVVIVLEFIVKGSNCKRVAVASLGFRSLADGVKVHLICDKLASVAEGTDF
jgi:hypothetical protein